MATTLLPATARPAQLIYLFPTGSWAGQQPWMCLSPLNPQTLLEAGVTATAAALTTEERKHDENDPKCFELGWVCIPVVAESYGAWGREATLLFSTIASRIATLSNKPKSVTLIDIYGRLNLQLVRANATSILARLMPPSY